jgi:hypothetical protein
MSGLLYQQFLGKTAIFTLALQNSSGSTHALYMTGVYVGAHPARQRSGKYTKSSIDEIVTPIFPCAGRPVDEC